MTDCWQKRSGQRGPGTDHASPGREPQAGLEHQVTSCRLRGTCSGGAGRLRRPTLGTSTSPQGPGEMPRPGARPAALVPGLLREGRPLNTPAGGCRRATARKCVAQCAGHCVLIAPGLKPSSSTGVKGRRAGPGAGRAGAARASPGSSRWPAGRFLPAAQPGGCFSWTLSLTRFFLELLMQVLLILFSCFAGEIERKKEKEKLEET